MNKLALAYVLRNLIRIVFIEISSWESNDFLHCYMRKRNTSFFHLKNSRLESKENLCIIFRTYTTLASPWFKSVLRCRQNYRSGRKSYSQTKKVTLSILLCEEFSSQYPCHVVKKALQRESKFPLLLIRLLWKLFLVLRCTFFFQVMLLRRCWLRSPMGRRLTSGASVSSLTSFCVDTRLSTMKMMRTYSPKS